MAEPEKLSPDEDQDDTLQQLWNDTWGVSPDPSDVPVIAPDWVKVYSSRLAGTNAEEKMFLFPEFQYITARVDAFRARELVKAPNYRMGSVAVIGTPGIG